MSALIINFTLLRTQDMQIKIIWQQGSEGHDPLPIRHTDDQITCAYARPWLVHALFYCDCIRDVH